ncbi:hypothetical protein FZ934_20635 (plasmid) [Rhizobium grahamii]|uniref:Uncharacterized protein n=1 Tax=Rhizobium grahamii TaxID=1120045 RepID=A0A5Q0CBQ1_9HYPH|nr:MULTISPECIES: hypothetical protein [Rhizobium]QFY62775.1 hypothetical protein FZ934_20635 [Rhizobium grahamii]QRM52479.1 hypothetical protein F3Y33_25025 [Rhizobium sp. BG6]
MQPAYRNVLAFSGYMFLVSIAVAFPHGHYVLVVADPRSSSRETIDLIGKADGSLVAFGRTSWMAVAYSRTDGFATRLMNAGAILVLNHSLAVGCQQKDAP